MRVIFFSIVLLLLVISEAGSQSRDIDSLRALLNKSEGTKRADVLNSYGYFILSYDYLEAEKMIKEGYDLSEELNYKKGQAEALLYQGTIEDRFGRNEKALSNFKRALAIANETKEKQLAGRVLASIGLLSFHKNKLDSAEAFYRQSYQYLKDSANPLFLSFLYLRFAELNKARNNLPGQLDYLKRSWEIRKSLSDKLPLAWVASNLAYYYTDRGEYNEAQRYVDYALKALGRDTTSEEAIALYRNKAIVYTNWGFHLQALDLFSKARKFYDQNPFRWNLVNVLTEIGTTQAEVSNFETSLKYYFQALKVAEENHFDQLIAQLYFRIARAYYFLGQNKLSEDFSQKCLNYASPNHFEMEEAFASNLLGLLCMRNHQFEKAHGYFETALALRTKNDYRIGIAGTLGNIGELYDAQNNLAKAEEYELKSLAIEESMDNAIGKCFSYQSLGHIYIQMKNFKKAEEYLNLGESVAQRINNRDILANIYKNKRELFIAKNDYPTAIKYSTLYDELKDSLINKNLVNRILSLQHVFELDQKDKEIELLNKQSLLQNREINLQRIAIAIGIVVLVIMAVVAFIVFRLYRKVKNLNREISEQNEEITAQSEELKEANDVLGDLNHAISEQKKQIEEQAEELTESNQTIARINEGLEEKIKQRTSELKEAYHELDTFFYRSSHDFRRPLTTFMGLAEVAKIMVTEKPALELFEKVNDTARNLDKMLAKLQSVSMVGNEELVKSEVFFKDIFDAEVDHFRDELLRKKIQIETRIEVSRTYYGYPALIKVIVQNLIENSILFCTDEHPRIALLVSETSDKIHLIIRDNGQGIDPVFKSKVFEMYFRGNEKSTGNGLGLYIVKKMVDRMNGTIAVKSELTQGTEIDIALPF